MSLKFYVDVISMEFIDLKMVFPVRLSDFASSAECHFTSIGSAKAEHSF
jgi:hypothetical protein